MIKLYNIITILIIIIHIFNTITIIDSKSTSSSFFNSNNYFKNHFKNDNLILASRLLQFKNVTSNIQIGPQKSSLCSSIILYHKQYYTTTDYKGLSVIIKQSDFSVDTINKLVKKLADSIIILLEEDNQQQQQQQQPETTDGDGYLIIKPLLSQKDYESIFISGSTKIPIPIYFVKEQEYNEMIQSTIKNSMIETSTQPETPQQQDDYKLLISLGLPTIINNPNSYNFQGILRGSANGNGGGSGEDKSKIPTIVILSSYDSYSIIPALSGELNNNGNAFVLFELSRILSTLYSNENTRGSYNILFSLVSSSSLNEYGVKRWYEQQSIQLVESIDHILCIDSIGMISSRIDLSNNNEVDQEIEIDPEEIINSNQLYLQVSKPSTKSQKIKLLYEKYEIATYNQGSNLSIVHKKIVIGNPKIQFQHEIFSRKQILSMTITQKPKQSINNNGYVNGGKSRLNLNVLKKNIKIVASTLLSIIYGNHNHDNNNNQYNHTHDFSTLLIDSSLDTNSNFIESWAQSFENTNIMFPYIQDKSLSSVSTTSTNTPIKTPSPKSKTPLIFLNSNLDNENNNNRVNILGGIELIFKENLDEFKRDIYKTDNSIEFYQPTRATMHFIRTKSVSFDIIILISSLFYLLIVYLILNDFKLFSNDFKLFSKQLQQKLKPSSLKKKKQQ